MKFVSIRSCHCSHVRFIDDFPKGCLVGMRTSTICTAANFSSALDW